MKASVRQFDAKKEYHFAEGCFITELSNSADDPGVSIARARVAPGTTTRWHRLRGTSERYVIIEGQGFVEIDSLPAQEVNVGDVVTIPPEVRQRIANAGPGDLVFLAICAPRFRAGIYEDMDS
ncbi:MAG: cupin domain-containing protein [Proteobacteria bacterium]|nr:cupin domain-containing protein [Pseudomonadota bacterium]